MFRAALTLGFLCLWAGCGGAHVAPATATDPTPGPGPTNPGPTDPDGDGVVGARDVCPDEPEDVDRFLDDDGCPDPDNDQDRIVDGVDQCPCVPEVFNGTEDEDGCPDRGSVLLIDERIQILTKVYFERRGAVLGAEDSPTIEALAATLAQHPFITRVEVAGHASRDEPRAQALSEARAAAVRDALVAAGVDSARLVVVGHGADARAMEGRSREANEANRRVEFVILEPADGRLSQVEDPLPGPVEGCPED